MIGIHIYKGLGLVYPPSVWAMELSGLIMLGLLQMIRLYFGFTANRTEGHADSVRFFWLTIMATYMVLHYTVLNTYVLFIEILLSVVPLVVFSPIELIVSLVAWRKFKSLAATG